MKADNQLSEVVVTALGSIKENRSLGYSIQTVEGTIPTHYKIGY